MSRHATHERSPRTPIPALAALVLSAGSALATEGRTPIASLPFTISQPGSYEVAADLTGVAGQHGITVQASDVTIDLSGFTLTGVPGSGDGVHLASGEARVAVRNGTVRGWGGAGVDLGGPAERLCVVEDLRAVANGGDGLRVGADALVRGCSATANQVGIRLESGLALGCEVEGNALDGLLAAGRATLVRGCRALGNGASGLRFTDGSGALVADNVASDNGDSGIEVATSALVLRNEASRNGGAGPIGAGVFLRSGANVALENHAVENLVGVLAFPGGLEVAARNSCFQNGAMEYDRATGNDFGPIGPLSSPTFDSPPWGNLAFFFQP